MVKQVSGVDEVELSSPPRRGIQRARQHPRWPPRSPWRGIEQNRTICGETSAMVTWAPGARSKPPPRPDLPRDPRPAHRPLRFPIFLTMNAVPRVLLSAPQRQRASWERVPTLAWLAHPVVEPPASRECTSPCLLWDVTLDSPSSAQLPIPATKQEAGPPYAPLVEPSRADRARSGVACPDAWRRAGADVDRVSHPVQRASLPLLEYPADVGP